ncbi:dihydrodipicolinate synthase family protein [Phycisphaerales bacterium AB-hyl4]|uniref:Dihydrodipicolinate synthase family protein n=1 Tax=Natronomicrosphaera hydrolytica TaxID=3242702 RepID=A0ABV4U6I3_9BACT
MASSKADGFEAIRATLQRGVAIPAHPLALNAQRKLDERRQRALSRYYIAAGSGGLAVGVHTTQFEIRESKYGLFEPVLTLAKEEMDRADVGRAEPLVRVGGIAGPTKQAVAEAGLLRELGYHAGLLSLAAMKSADDDELIAHCQAVSEVIPVVGFYLQSAVGGRPLPFAFWRRLAELPNVVAIKIAPFNRYQTLDVVRAVAESGRDDLTLYTGNDDNIVLDLLTPHRFCVDGQVVERRIVGGLLGHWSVWTQKAAELLTRCQHVVANGGQVDADMLALAIEVTDSNAAFFDAANGFAGCIAGLHEVLRRQGLLEGIWCLNPDETLGRGQLAEIDRVYAAYPHLNDDAFVAEHRDAWLAG